MASNIISATMTSVMWCEERLWNVSILQRVHLSSLHHQYYCTTIMKKSNSFYEVVCLEADIGTALSNTD
jgi:hypothetical protein